MASAQSAPEGPLGSLIDFLFSAFNPNSGIAQNIFSWVATFVPTVFGAIAVAELLYSLAINVLTGSGNESMFRELAVKVFKISIAFVIVQNAGTIITSAYNFIGVYLGQQFASSAAQSLGMPAPNVSSPGTIVESGINLAFSLLFPSGGNIQSVMAMLGEASVGGFVLPLFLIVAFSGVPPAFMLAMTWIKFTVSAYGAVLLVFLPSRVTQNIANGVMQLFTTLAVQTLAITGWCGLMVGVYGLIQQRLGVAGQTASAALSAAGNAMSNLNIAGAVQSLAQAAVAPIETWVYATIAVVTLSIVSLLIPKIAESWLTGAPSLSFGDALRMGATALAAAVMPAAAVAGTASALTMLGGGAGAGAAAAGGSVGGANPNLPSGGNSIAGGGSSGGGAGGASGGGGGGGGLGPFSPGMVQGAAVAANVAGPVAQTLRDMAQHFEPARGSAHLNIGV